MCEVHNEWYVESTTDLKARWRHHKRDAKLKKATKCGVAHHVTNFKHPEDPQFGFLTIVAVEAVKEKKDLIVRNNYWMCNLGTIFKGMNTRKDLNTVLKDRSSKRERERENSLLKKDHGAMSIVVMNIVKQLSINVKLQVQHLVQTR